MLESIDAYLLLNAATQLFDKPPASLSESEWQEAVALAEKESLLQARILASPEAEFIALENEAVENARAEIEGRYSTHSEYLEALMRNGMNESTLIASLSNSLKVEKIMMHVADQVTVSEDDIAAAYTANLAHFEHQELREARHILITINNDYAENRRKQVKVRMQQLSMQLAASPELFADLALRHSECPTSLEGGYLGKIPRGKLFNELDQRLFAMHEGEISDMIESPMGMHLIMCEKIHTAGVMPLAEAAALIRARMLESRRTIAQKQWIRALFKSER